MGGPQSTGRPPSAVAWTYGVSTNTGETLGRPQLVGIVSQVWDGLPQEQREHAVIYTADYGEAGATTVLAVAPGPEHTPGYEAQLRRNVRHVTVAAGLTNPYGMHNVERGGHVYVCTGPRRSWAEMWPQLRHYG